MDRSIYQGKASMQTSIYAGLSALVADEFENSRKSIRQMLQGLGIENVDQTGSGKGVIELCRSKTYDLILCDFRLVGEKNGQQILEELRELKLLKSDTIYVIISAETSRDIVMGIMESQPDEYLTKPFTQSVLAKRLERQFAQSRALSEMKSMLNKREYKELIDACESHIKENGRYLHWCQKTLVDACLKIGLYEKAEKICKNELKSRDIDWALLFLAKIEVEKGRLDSAIVILEKLLTLFPQTIDAYDLLADCLKRSGKIQEAQSILEDAIRISPRIHKRQKHMVEICKANNDLNAAMRASQQSLKLGLNSIYESPDDYVEFIDIVGDASSSLESLQDRKRFIADANQALQVMSKRFGDDDEVRVRKALVESRFLAHQGKQNEAEKALKNAKKMLSEIENELPGYLVLEYGKALYGAGEDEEAQKILSSLIEEDEVSEALKQQASDFLDEPVDNATKIKTKVINKDALISYSKKDYEEAIMKFKEALKLSPKNPGLNLNLIQSCLKYMEEINKNSQMINECKNAFSRVNHVSQSHKQYKRLMVLKEYFNKFSN